MDIHCLYLLVARIVWYKSQLLLSYSSPVTIQCVRNNFGGFFFFYYNAIIRVLKKKEIYTFSNKNDKIFKAEQGC